VSAEKEITIKKPANYILCFAELEYEEARLQAIEEAFKLI
jgi:hypothetical protein